MSDIVWKAVWNKFTRIIMYEVIDSKLVEVTVDRLDGHLFTPPYLLFRAED